MATDDYWLDAGRPELYLQANLDVLGNTRRHDRCQAVHETAIVDVAAVIEHSVVGADARVGAATLRGSVLLPGAVVDPGAVVTDSVVMGRVGAGAVVHNSVVGADGVVAPGEHISGERRPDPDADPAST
jgi:NDP-sugar pyrophosphorylase family protein